VLATSPAAVDDVRGFKGRSKPLWTSRLSATPRGYDTPPGPYIKPITRVVVSLGRRSLRDRLDSSLVVDQGPVSVVPTPARAASL
jgi:hypothetical protein